MRKLIITAIILTAALYASGMYNGEEINGDKKYCYYTDGTVITVKSYGMCPMSL